MTTPNNKQQPLWNDAERTTDSPVECLGMTFASDAERREYFLAQLRAGLDDLSANLAGVPFTTVDAAVARMQAVTRWPLGDAERLRAMAEAMRDAEPGKDLLQRWKNLVGFPIGEDEDILRLSDPPYYTACPNPFLPQFVMLKFQHNEQDPSKNNPHTGELHSSTRHPVYNFHPYHTKVPPEVIYDLIQHYSQPGDLILDGFC
jgi:hypothetical protein